VLNVKETIVSSKIYKCTELFFTGALKKPPYTLKNTLTHVEERCQTGTSH